MNALSGAYVSEVTSLPGYPCLVYVQHGEAPRFALTRYNGRESVFANANVLKDVIADSHVALAQQIHEAEDRGAAFDPAADFPESIRRVDVSCGCQSLAIEHRHRGYPRPLQPHEFRLRRAHARVSRQRGLRGLRGEDGQLYLEQVFEEFDQLLALFSRIFLVINVDASKRDLQSDGTLQPSAESSEPEKVVQAFTTLSMSGPLRQAYAQNRVRIHALDLLNAAPRCCKARARTAQTPALANRGSASTPS